MNNLFARKTNKENFYISDSIKNEFNSSEIENNYLSTLVTLNNGEEFNSNLIKYSKTHYVELTFKANKAFIKNLINDDVKSIKVLFEEEVLFESDFIVSTDIELVDNYYMANCLLKQSEVK